MFLVHRRTQNHTTGSAAILSVITGVMLSNGITGRITALPLL